MKEREERSLFAYLVLRRLSPVDTMGLVEAFWPDQRPSDAGGQVDRLFSAASIPFPQTGAPEIRLERSRESAEPAPETQTLWPISCNRSQPGASSVSV
jgi:hypothetical protein